MFEKPSELLRKAREKAGFKSAAEAAEKHDWGEAGYRHHENGQRRIGPDAARKYQKAFGVRAEDLLGFKEPRNSRAETFEEDVVAAMGMWRDTSISNEPNKSRSRGTVTRKRVLVNDDSVNKAINAGEWALYEPFDSRSDPLPDQRLVYIERKKGSLAERSIRQVRIKGSGATLTSHSTVSKYSEKLDFPSKSQGESIEIIGVVVGKQVDFD